MAGNTVVFKPASASPRCRRSTLIEAYRDAGVPDGVFNLVMGPGDTVGEELQDNPGIDGIVFTGSYEVGMRAVPHVLDARARGRASSRWAARTRRSSRATPTSRRRPRGSCGQRVRLRRPEVLGELAGLRRAAGPRRARPAARREDRGDHDRRPARPRRTGSGPVIDQRGRRPPPAGGRRGAPRRDGLHRRRAPDRRRPGARLLRRADGRRRPAGRRTGCSSDELFAPFTAVHAVDSLDEALALANDSVYGLTAGVYSEDPAEVQQLPRQHRGGRPVRQPARRRDDRRLAGRPGVRRLEGQRLDRQGRPVDVLRRAVPARAEPHHRRLTDRAVARRNASCRSFDRPSTSSMADAGRCRAFGRGSRDLRVVADRGPALLLSYSLCITSMRFAVPGERRSGRRTLGSAPRRPRDDPARGAHRPAHRHRAARPQGPGARRVRPRLDAPEPAARLPDRPRARRRLRGRGHRRQRVPRLRRRHRRQLDRPQPPRRRRRDPATRPPSCIHFSATDFYLPIYAEAAAELARIAPIGGPARAFLGNSGAEAVEAGHQARPLRHQAAERRRVPRRLPRPDVWAPSA